VTLVEICVDDVAGAVAAEAAGVERIELCSALSEGGITPSIGLVRAVLGRLRQTDVMVMIRPRGGDFIVSAEELAVMLADIAAIRAEPHAPGVTVGFVFGALDAAGAVDEPTTAALVSACRAAPKTFHKAFDVAADLPAALERLIVLGLDRVLTSGGAPTAEAGAPMLRRLATQAAGRLIVLGGGGVRSHNLTALLAEVSLAEVHLRAVRPDATGRLVTAPEGIVAVLKVARAA
jgi:copper homeostasis protein